MKGIALLPRKPGKVDSRYYDVSEIIFELDGDLSIDFYEKIGCGDSLEGEGTLMRTGEKIK